MKDGSMLKVLQMTGDIRIILILIGKVLNAIIVLRSFYVEKVLVSNCFWLHSRQISLRHKLELVCLEVLFSRLKTQHCKNDFVGFAFSV